MTASLSPVTPALDIIASVIHLLNPSDLESLKAEIRKVEEKHDERRKKALEALSLNDVDALNALLFGDDV